MESKGRGISKGSGQNIVEVQTSSNVVEKLSKM